MMTGHEQRPDTTETSTSHVTSTQPSTSNSASRKQKNVTKTQTLIPIRKPDWAYIQLQHISTSSSSSSSQALDGITAQLHLNAALSSFLGLHGSAIPVDILRLEGHYVWARVPADDRAALIAATGGWMSSSGHGWRVKGWSSWSASALGRDAGQELFN